MHGSASEDFASQSVARPRLQVWLVRACAGILLWTCMVQLMTVRQIWHRPGARLLNLGGGQTRDRVIGNSQTPLGSPMLPASKFININIIIIILMVIIILIIIIIVIIIIVLVFIIIINKVINIIMIIDIIMIIVLIVIFFIIIVFVVIIIIVDN